MRVRKCNEKTVQGTMRDDDDDVDDAAHSVFVLFFFLVLGFRSRFGVRVTRSRRCSAPATWVDGRVGRAGRGGKGRVPPVKGPRPFSFCSHSRFALFYGRNEL